MVVTVVVKKIPRYDSIPVVHKDFPPLSGLKLDMLENKNKLKKFLILLFYFLYYNL